MQKTENVVAKTSLENCRRVSKVAGNQRFGGIEIRGRMRTVEMKTCLQGGRGDNLG